MIHVALFGTSADPPTVGHQTILQWLSDRFDQVAVWASNNPFKVHQTPLFHRIAMLQLVINDIDRSNLRLYPQLSHARTIHTLESVREIWPNAQFTLVIGSDLIGQLLTWYRVDELFGQVDLLIIPRPGHPIQQSQLQQLRQRGATLAIADLIGLDTSSSTYREHHDSDELTPSVAAYIHRKQLYLCQADSREKQPAQ
jgi:nicotinate-nucleotide adenylyltransferase